MTTTDGKTRTISIHAPAKGATGLHSLFDVTDLNFNPRSREGSDADVQQARNDIMPFQSTLPRRERLGRGVNAFKLLKFQSTLPRRERRLW